MGKKIITDKEFNIALNDQNNKAIMGSACAPFRNSIDFDELHSIKLLSLWAALKTWREDGRRFSSYLYQQVRWNCIKSVQDNAKNVVYDINFDRQAKRCGNFGEIIEQLPEDLRDIFIHRFSFGMTLREIAKTHGFCCETGRRKLIKGLAILRDNQ